MLLTADSAQLSWARLGSARLRSPLDFPPTRNCWDRRWESSLCCERLIFFFWMSGLHIIESHFSFPSSCSQVQLERGIFLDRSACWACQSGFVLLLPLLLLHRLWTVVVMALREWYWKVCLVFFCCFCFLKASSGGTPVRFLPGLDGFGFEFSDCRRAPRSPVPVEKCRDEVWKSSLCDFFSLHLCVR